MRKSKMSRRTAGKKRAGRSSARKSVAQGVKRAKRQTVKSRSKTGSRTRVSAMGRFGQSIRAARSVHGKIGTTASKRALKARKKKARKTPRTRKQTVTRLIAPVAQAA